MNIIEILQVEHGVLLRILALIDLYAADHKGANATLEMCKMVTRLLLSHATMEDEILYVAMNSHPGVEMPPAVAQNRADHMEMEKLFRIAVEGGPDSADETHQATTFTREHIIREEMILFTLARNKLDITELEQLGRQAEEYLALIRK